MPDTGNTAHYADSRPAVRERKFNISLVWLVPIIAALVGLSMVIHNAMNAGPVIHISFQTADGLEANKTQVKYKNVVIGVVTGIALSPDRSQVIAAVELDHESKAFTSEDSKFWVVRPRIGSGGVSGVETLLSGAFIGADPGQSERTQLDFTGLESPPPVTMGQAGTHFQLHTEDLGSLDVGSPVSYRRMQVGQVVSYKLDDDGKGVLLDIFVNAPVDRFVSHDTRFWNASGVDVSLDANGLKVNTQSFSTLLAGGIAFVEPKYSPQSVRADENARFELYKDQDSALARPDGQPRYFRMRFTQPLRGLAVGAPVEFMGVNLGKVVSLDLDYDPGKRTFSSMVGAVIYPERLGKAHEKILVQMAGDDDAKVASMMGLLVREGLRAQVRTGNLLTGQLYIALDFIADATPVSFDVAQRPLLIPTAPGDFDKMQEQLKAVVNKIAALPLDRIANNLDRNLVSLNNVLRQVDGQVLPHMQATFTQAELTLKAVNRSLYEDSPERQQLAQALQEFQRTARSIRLLTDFLGRQPESLVRGRLKEGQPDVLSLHSNQSRAIADEPIQ